MQLVRGIHNIGLSDDSGKKSFEKGCALTIGNFDGVHLGHRRVIAALIEQAKEIGCEAVVMVFEPQPQELFSPGTAPARLCRLRDKYTLLKNLGVDRLLCVNFNQKFASQSAKEFVEQLLVKRLAVKHLIIGDDFHFGQNRQGNFDMLCQAGKKFGFSVTDTASFKLADCRISSTEIRQALEQNRLADAEKMLGRPYSIIGRVFHGDKRGREIGFPTANVSLKRKVSPITGVYAVQIKATDGHYYGVANIGSRPTVLGKIAQLEVHIFDFNKNLYGQNIEVIILKKLRSEIKFESINALTAQIDTDTKQARIFLNNKYKTRY
jgi:riboflavin kinase/FMN adenylyltransferase